MEAAPAMILNALVAITLALSDDSTTSLTSALSDSNRRAMVLADSSIFSLVVAPVSSSRWYRISSIRISSSLDRSLNSTAATVISSRRDFPPPGIKRPRCPPRFLWCIMVRILLRKLTCCSGSVCRLCCGLTSSPFLLHRSFCGLI